MGKRKATSGPITAKVKAAIKASEKSLYKIAKESGIPYPTMHRFDAGERDIKLATLDKLAEVLKLDVVQRK